jgi:predicted DNA-binding protein (MmcQ/YjbR family)
MPYLGRYGSNSLIMGGAISDAEVLEAVDASYFAVLEKLPKRERPAMAEG